MTRASGHVAGARDVYGCASAVAKPDDDRVTGREENALSNPFEVHIQTCKPRGSCIEKAKSKYLHDSKNILLFNYSSVVLSGSHNAPSLPLIYICG